MFGSTTPLGQSTNSPFGTPSAFGQTNNATNNPFAPEGFGSGSPFGSQTGTSIFGGTSTDVFEGTPFSSLAFGSSLFSTPALRTSMFGGTSTDCFEGTPFSSLAFGSSLYSTPALRTSSPAFGSSTFGAASTPAFGTGSSSSSLFSTPAFGTSVPAFERSAFGVASTAFGSGSSSSSLFSTPAFGTFSPAFGSSAFGAASTPAFGTGSSSFGGAQSTTPAFGSPGFGQQAFGGQRGGTRVVSYTPTSEVDGGSGTQPAGKLESIAAMPAYKDKSHEELRWEDYQLGDKGGRNPASQPASGIGFGAPAQSSPFGISGTFGQPSANPFSSSATSNPFVPKTQNFGSTGFGAFSSPTFSSPFGVTFSSPFGSSRTPAFSATSTPAFGSSNTPAFGASSTPSFTFGSSPAFVQSTAVFGSSTFGTTPFGSQSSPFGGQSATPAFGSPGFGQQAFGCQRGGTRVVSYTPTSEVDGGSGTQPAGKLESIAATPAYKDKSHEELRWEDYQLGDKGGPNPASQPASGIGSGVPAQSSPFGTSGTFGQPPAPPFSSSTTSNPFAPKTQTFGSTGFGASSSPAVSSPFGVTSSSPFGCTSSSTTPSMFGPAPAFGATSSTSLFGASSTHAFGASSSSLIFGSTSAGSSPAFGSALNFSNTQASGLFQSSTPSLGQASIFGSATPTFGQITNSSFGQQNLFSTPSAGFGGNLFRSNSAPSLLNTSNPIGFGQTTIMGQERQHKNLVNLREKEMESSPAVTDSASTKESCVSSSFHPCHYLDLALKASLKCFGFDPDFTNSSTESEAAVGSSVVVPGADHALNSIHNIKAALPEICEAEAEQVKEVLPSTAV